MESNLLTGQRSLIVHGSCFQFWGGFQVLEKYGAPPKICSVIERLYTDLKVVFKLGGITAEIKQGVGVRQGDNMAPVLFLFLMAALSELLEDTWEREGIVRTEACRESDETFRKGQLQLQAVARARARHLQHTE
ncbi:hypothetical protein ACHAWF_011093 [Thalassiosira exigua]